MFKSNLVFRTPLAKRTFYLTEFLKFRHSYREIYREINKQIEIPKPFGGVRNRKWGGKSKLPWGGWTQDSMGGRNTIAVRDVQSFYFKENLYYKKK